MFTTILFSFHFIFLYVAPSSCSFVFIPTFCFVSSAIAPIVIVSTFLSMCIHTYFLQFCLFLLYFHLQLLLLGLCYYFLYKFLMYMFSISPFNAFTKIPIFVGSFSPICTNLVEISASYSSPFILTFVCS